MGGTDLHIFILRVGDLVFDPALQRAIIASASGQTKHGKKPQSDE